MSTLSSTSFTTPPRRATSDCSTASGPAFSSGLTATPERSDGLDVLRYFGGHLSAQIRLPDAINRKLLSPFQYFAVTDSEDLSGLKWQRGGYRLDELDRIYTGNDLRAALVIDEGPLDPP